MTAQEIGALGEIYAARHLRDKGYSILNVNYRVRGGEIDIIAQKQAYIVFAEVKTRTAGAIATPGESVDVQKQRRLITAAQHFQAANALGEEQLLRFDVLEVYLEKNGDLVRVCHLENAFDDF